MRFFLLTINVFFLISYSFGQRLSYQFPEKFSSIYDFKPDEAYDIITKGTKNIDETATEYRINKIYNTQFDFDINNVYMNWDEPEVYLIKLMDSLIPDSSALKKHLNLFISRDPSYNAHTTSTGLFFINIGLLAKVRNEAVLAHVIAHECGHYLLNHQKQKEDIRANIYQKNTTVTHFYNKAQLFELEADAFAAVCISRMGYDLKYVSQEFDNLDMKSRVYMYSRGYNNMIKASEKTPEQLGKLRNKPGISISTHPLEAERMLLINKIKEKYNGNKKYIVDSLLFLRLRKAAREECKKIYFDNADYNSCLEIAFIDYLYEPNNVKNIYYITESLRRFMYIKPKQSKTPFLMDGIEDNEMFYNNQSILYKPDYLFTDYEEYEELKNHPFFSEKKKPFNTYQEAFIYFSNLGLKFKLNEVNLSLALYHYGNKNSDSLNYYLKEYIAPGNGLYTEFASKLLEKQQPYIDASKTFMLVDNIGNYSGYSFNYYLAKKRKKFNPEIKTLLQRDDKKTDLVFMNEYSGKNPKYLSELQKLEANIFKLYSEEDIFIFKKKWLSTKETQEETGLSHKFNKHFLILVPEYYKWFKEHDYNKIFLVESVHQSKGYLEEEEYYNTYTGYYLDINAIRPYFRDAVRNGFYRKQSNKQMYDEMADFLYNKE